MPPLPEEPTPEEPTPKESNRDISIPEKLFVYGTFLPNEPNFYMLNEGVANPQRALVKGALVMHDQEERKRYPFLIVHLNLLEKLRKNTGICSHDVQGELFDITDPTLLQRLDRFEGINIRIDSLEERIEGMHSAPLQDLYVRKKIGIQTESGEMVNAWVYVANPSKDHSERLVERIRTKIIVPGGDWREYSRNRDQSSLQVEARPGHTFGMETEFSLQVRISKGKEMPLPGLISKSGFYHFSFADGKKARFRTLGEILSQTLYDSLQKKGLGSRVISHYYEKHPEFNHRFLIPGGIAYVEGEHVRPDGTDVQIRRLGLIARASKTEDTGEKMHRPQFGRVFLPLELTYFEVAGFPTNIEQGFATHTTITEFIRRHHLALALEDIVGVKKDITWLKKEFRMEGNSSQYNVLVDPYLGEGKIDLSRCKTLAPFAEITRKNPQTHQLQGGRIQEEQVTKFTRDVGYVLGKTFGPLLSYFLSGKKLEYVEFKPRDGNRLEYRNTVLQSMEQLMAGIAVYAAAVKTVEEKIKDNVAYEASRQLLKPLEELTEKEVIDIFKEMSPDNFVTQFSEYLPGVNFLPAKFRGGYQVDWKDSYHTQVHAGTKQKILICIRAEVGAVEVSRVIETLFYDEAFNQNLRAMTTPSEYETCAEFARGEKQVEIYRRRVTDKTTSVNTAEKIRQFSRTALADHYDAGSTYPEIMTHLLFRIGGQYQFEDEDHRLVIGIDQEEIIEIDEKKNKVPTILIGSVPLEISLYKKNTASFDESSDSSPEEFPVDSFKTRVHPGNIERLRTAVNLLERPSGKPPIWEAFYRLK